MALVAGVLPFLARRHAWRLAPALPCAAAVACGSSLLWFVGIAATLATLRRFRRRLLALTVLGAVGLVVALVFVYLSAPDLALTQLLVELATDHPDDARAELAAAGERRRNDRPRGERCDAIVACGAALASTALVWLVLARARSIRSRRTSSRPRSRWAAARTSST